MQRIHWAFGFVFMVASASAGCQPDEMHPGEACGSCHNGDRAPAFGAAGTVYSDPAAAAGDGLENATVATTLGRRPDASTFAKP